MRQSPNDCPHLSQVPLSVVRPRAGTVSCATRTSPHSEQRLPSVSPVFVQVGSTAGITSSTWVCLSVLPLLVFPPLVFPAFPPPQTTRGSVIATASKIVVNFLSSASLSLSLYLQCIFRTGKSFPAPGQNKVFSCSANSLSLISPRGS